MKDRLIVLGNQLLKNIDRVGIGVFLALFIASGVLFLRESEFIPPEITSPPPSPFEERIPNEEFELVVANMTELDEAIEENPRILRLIQAPMFDARRVRETVEALAEIESDYRRAESALEAGNLTEATRLVESILRRNPTHRRTLVLQEQIAEAQGGGDPAPQQENGSD